MLGSVAIQFRRGGRFYTRNVCWSFLIEVVKKLLQPINRNWRYYKNKSGSVLWIRVHFIKLLTEKHLQQE